MFCNIRGPSPAEMAEEVLEGLSEAGGGVGSLDPTDESRLVTVMTLHLGRLAIAQMSGQKGSSILLDATSLATSIDGNQDYQQFQFRYHISPLSTDIQCVFPGLDSQARLGQRVPSPHQGPVLSSSDWTVSLHHTQHRHSQPSHKTWTFH